MITLHHSDSVEITEFYSHAFLTKILWKEGEFHVFPHCVHNVEDFSATQILREINLAILGVSKTAIWPFF